MTTLALPGRVESHAKHAAAVSRSVKFTRVLFIVFAGLFYCLGYAPGFCWRGVVFAALMIRQGFAEGSGAHAAGHAPAASP